MPTGAITGYIDVAQLTLYAFWIFFACLIFYLRREDKREGYPLETERPGVTTEGFPPMPRPKTFLLPHGGVQTAPRVEPPELIANAVPTAPWAGAPLEPTGNPLLSGIGPSAYAKREDTPDVTFEGGYPRIVPLRVATDFFLALEDPDPIGMEVIGADGVVAGLVTDAWIDRSEVTIRYLQVEVTTAAGPRRVLLPMTSVQIDAKRRQINVRSLLAVQFVDVPATKSPDEVTLLEEDQITAYYSGGQLFAEPSRLGPIL